MQKELIQIGQIPAVVWGEPAESLIIAVHGNLSHKEDIPIALLAKHGCAKGYQVLSFELPEHGARKAENILCKVQICVPELLQVLQYAKKHWSSINVFGNSIGAYFALLAYADAGLERAWFLSPVVDMQQIIETLMGWFQVSLAHLEQEQVISTPIGQTLYWDYYCYVREHPVHCWQVSTAILYGGKDELCQQDTILQFVRQFGCQLEIVPDAEHYFHTAEELQALERWMEQVL